MTTWLDTETKALLQPSPPKKLAPPDTATFSLVLLAVRGHDRSRLAEAVQRILGDRPGDARNILAHTLPVVVRCGLAHEDALLGQFELIACDAISVFLAEDVVAEASFRYLADLFAQLLKSAEFEAVSVRIESIPSSERGTEFVNRFLGREQWKFPVELRFMRKKARIMEHWATKIGGRVMIVSNADPEVRR